MWVYTWKNIFSSVQFSRSVMTPWTTALQVSLSITSSRSLLKLRSITSVMLSNHLIFCCPLLPPSIFPSTRVFSNESVLHIRWPKYWSFSFSISPFNEYKLLRWSCFSLSAPLGKMSISETCQKYIHMTLLWSRSPTAQLKVWHVTVGP